MTIIELNIAGLHVTRSGPDFTREAFKGGCGSARAGPGRRPFLALGRSGAVRPHDLHRGSTTATALPPNAISRRAPERRMLTSAAEVLRERGAAGRDDRRGALPQRRAAQAGVPPISRADGIKSFWRHCSSRANRCGNSDRRRRITGPMALLRGFVELWEDVFGIAISRRAARWWPRRSAPATRAPPLSRCCAHF